MGLCKDCLKNHVDNSWYLNDEDRKIVEVDACMYHPVFTNWRVTRTLRSIIYWSKCGENYRHPHARGVRLCLSFGRVHRRTAEAILFDYEKPFIDLLIKSGYIEQEENFDDVSRVLRVLPGYDDYLKSMLTVKQYEFFQQELKELMLKDIKVTTWI